MSSEMESETLLPSDSALSVPSQNPKGDPRILGKWTEEGELVVGP